MVDFNIPQNDASDDAVPSSAVATPPSDGETPSAERQAIPTSDRGTGPTVMVLDGDYDNALQVATEVSRDLDATVVGVGTSDRSRVLRSKHCDVGVATVPSDHDDYPNHLLDAVERYRPDVVVPVGYHSVAAMDSIRDRLPDGVECCLPPSDSLSAAVDKADSLATAADLGIDVPADYTEVVAELDERGRPGGLSELSFPVFLKARHECGENVTGRVDDPAAFWETYDELTREADDDVLVQEYVDDHRTYACGVLFTDGTPTTLFAHEEVRSVPRQGGSGTRVGLYRDPELVASAVTLLEELGWNGPALVEFKRRADGSYALMEINPKLWASYALASRAGYRVVSTMIAETLDLAWMPSGPPDRSYEMTFPLRELQFAATTDDESLLESLAAVCWPPAHVDVRARDIRAWLTPPADPDPDRSALDTTPVDLDDRRAGAEGRPGEDGRSGDTGDGRRDTRTADGSAASPDAMD